jgi:hypothetical protein
MGPDITFVPEILADLMIIKARSPTGGGIGVSQADPCSSLISCQMRSG